MRVDNTSNTGWTEAARALEQVFAQLGDMLADIAQRYGISVDALRAANPGVGDRLAPGDAVRLPTAAELAAPQASVHTVRRGETLSGIAKAHGLTLGQLLAANPQIRDPNRIAVGQAVNLPTGAAAVPATPKTGTQPDTPTTPIAVHHELGGLSEKYETGGRGPGTVSTGKGDPGGVSYGSYQLASKTGTVQAFLRHEGAPWAAEFKGMDPTVSRGAFETQWKAIAARDPKGFAAAQHAFIQRTHYEPVVKHALGTTGLDISQRSPAVQDAVWSVSVQHGKAKALIERAVRSVTQPASSPDYDRALVKAIYAERTRYVSGLALPEKTKESLLNRYENELADALRMLDSH